MTQKMKYMLEVWIVGVTTATVLYLMLWSLAAILTVASEREEARTPGRPVVTAAENANMRK